VSLLIFPEIPALQFRIALHTTATATLPIANDGGRGRIRTSVARKERQIYSLLVLATHPPVRKDRGIHASRNSFIAGRYDEQFPATLLAGLPAEPAEINVK
jgi:hypothetical protein